MRITIATPLYPPDIAEPAPYVKELARRLTEQKHKVTVVLYGHLPEIIPSVHFVCIDKRDMLLVRLTRYLFALFRAVEKADVLYVMNGASVEAPAYIVALMRGIPFILHQGDKDANDWVRKRAVLRFIKRTAASKARAVMNDFPMPRPEILPFQPRPEKTFVEYEASWERHTRALIDTLEHALQK